MPRCLGLGENHGTDSTPCKVQSSAPQPNRINAFKRSKVSLWNMSENMTTVSRHSALVKGKGFIDAVQSVRIYMYCAFVCHILGERFIYGWGRTCHTGGDWGQVVYPTQTEMLCLFWHGGTAGFFFLSCITHFVTHTHTHKNKFLTSKCDIKGERMKMIRLSCRLCKLPTDHYQWLITLLTNIGPVSVNDKYQVANKETVFCESCFALLSKLPAMLR